MKYHLTLDNKISVCGIKNSPEKFLFPLLGFVGHYNKECKCKVCEKIRTAAKNIQP